MNKHELYKQLEETIQNFIKEHNLSCENCIYFDTKSKTHCKSKLNCIMEKYNGVYINYTENEIKSTYKETV